MIRKAIISLILLMVLLPAVASAEGAVTAIKPLEELTLQTQKLVEQTNNNQIAEARNTLAQISEMFTRISFDGIATVEGIDALSSTIIKTKHAFAPIKLDQEEAAYYATMLHLGVEALNHEEQPLWLNYEKVLHNDLNAIEKYMNNHQWTDVDNQLVLLQRHYELIRPAIFISRSAQVVEKMDSLVKFTQQQFNQSEVNYSQVTFSITQLREALDALFKGGDKDVFSVGTFPQTPTTITLTIGSIIIACLSFVAWKRYRVDQRVTRRT